MKFLQKANGLHPKTPEPLSFSRFLAAVYVGVCSCGVIKSGGIERTVVEMVDRRSILSRSDIQPGLCVVCLSSLSKADVLFLNTSRILDDVSGRFPTTFGVCGKKCMCFLDSQGKLCRTINWSLSRVRVYQRCASNSGYRKCVLWPYSCWQSEVGVILLESRET